MFLAEIRILTKASILDPQGQAVNDALHKLGHKEIEDVRIGRYIELKIKLKEKAEAEKRVQTYCESLLANTVIESYSFTLEASDKALDP